MSNIEPRVATWAAEQNLCPLEFLGQCIESLRRVPGIVSRYQCGKSAVVQLKRH
jgi:hypothetical protein